jgi:predicted nucleotidyltransferase
MIPALDDDGYLPPGIHSATLDEIEARFGRESELRQVQMESIRWLVDLARRAGVVRIVVNGSFTTGRLEPNDVDCALLIEPGFPLDERAEEELIEGLPFLDIHPVRQDGWDEMVGIVFATDRRRHPKGMIEVVSWN